MSIVMALSDSFILAHIFPFLKSWTAGMLAAVFEVPWAPVQKSFSAVLTDPCLGVFLEKWLKNYFHRWTESFPTCSTLLPEHEQRRQRMLRRDHVFQLSWGGGGRRYRCWDGLEHFLNQNTLPDSNICILGGGRGWEESTLPPSQICHQSVDMTITEKMVMNWSSYFAACGL